MYDISPTFQNNYAEANAAVFIDLFIPWGED